MININTYICQYSSEPLSLTGNQVHIWATALDQPPIALATLRNTLSGDELLRSQRYATPELQQRFIIGRSILRMLLSRYTGLAAKSVGFVYGKNGKPALDEQSDASSIHFNMSHSANLAVYAFSAQTALGVDIEYVQPVPDMWRVAQRFFAAEELSVLRGIPEEQQLRAFYRCWVHKEAFVKASGRGLTHGLDSFAISFAHEQPATLLQPSGNLETDIPWSIAKLPLPHAYEGALALQSTALVELSFRLVS